MELLPLGLGKLSEELQGVGVDRVLRRACALLPSAVSLITYARRSSGFRSRLTKPACSRSSIRETIVVRSMRSRSPIAC
jgi:hypothetical protein